MRFAMHPVKYISLVFFICSTFFCSAQKRGSVWCFGDSALVDFSDTTNIVAGMSNIKSRGSCVSISDSSGLIQFYAYTRANLAGNTTLVRNANNFLMQNGDSIVGEGWYRELIIIPYPGSDSLFYIFSIGITGSSQTGLYYSTIDLSTNGGFGTVIQKNVQLQSFPMVDCLNAIKHGNGRDWWIIFRKWNTSSPNNEFYLYLVTPSGISNVSVQSLGATQSSGFGGIAFSTDGNRFAYINPRSLIELYYFDRCTGSIYNHLTIHSENPQPPDEAYWGVAFSTANNYLYVSKLPYTSMGTPDTSRLFQFDLTSGNILQSVDTISSALFDSQFGFLKRGDNGKIYLTSNFYGGFPYPDSVYNQINMNLSVINLPDSAGLACDFQPYSFYLGGKRTYFGLPNNPYYHLGPKIGSGCDTLLAINEQSQNIVISNLFPNPNNGEFTINYFLPNGKSGTLEVFNITGQKIYEMKLPRYTYMQDVELKDVAKGIYLVRLTSGNKITMKKFIKQ